MEAVKPYFGPQNLFDCAFIEHRYCIMWPLISENKQKLDKKEKKQNYVILVFFSKKFYFQKQLITKWKIWIGSSILSKEALRSAIIQNKIYVYKKNVKYDKSRKLIYFLLWKTRVEASKVIPNSLKTFDFVTPILFDTFSRQDKKTVIFNLSLTRAGNKQTIKGTKLGSWNVFFFHFGKQLFSKSWKPLSVF